LLLYHEATVCNILEIILYHRTACENSEDSLIELIDYLYRKLLNLKNNAENGNLSNKIKDPKAVLN